MLHHISFAWSLPNSNIFARGGHFYYSERTKTMHETVRFGTWEHILPPLGKTFWKCKKFWTKIWRVHLDVLCAHNKFRAKMIFFVICVKKTKKCLVKSLLLRSKFVFFYTRHNKCRFSLKRLCEHIGCRDACTKLFVQIFWSFKIFLKCIFKTRSICFREPKLHPQD